MRPMYQQVQNQKDGSSPCYVQQIQNQKTGDETFYINNIIFKIDNNGLAQSQVKKRSNSTDAATMKSSEEKIFLKSINQLSDIKCNCMMKNAIPEGMGSMSFPPMQGF